MQTTAASPGYMHMNVRRRAVACVYIVYMYVHARMYAVLSAALQSTAHDQI